MRFLIVNGDDLGASHGINRGILQAHHQGVLTSASLMVNARHSQEAADLAREARQLSVGLHFDIDQTPREPGALTEELERQLARFQELMGQRPTHLDSHHNTHCHPQCLPHFLALARRCGLPLRGYSPVRTCSTFYGQWHGHSHPDQISIEGFLRIVEEETANGVTELSCHPGFVDADFATSYSAEREMELRTLCRPTLHRTLLQREVYLVNFHHLDSWPPLIPAA